MMFEVSQEAREMMKRFMENRKAETPVRVMVAAGG